MVGGVVILASLLLTFLVVVATQYLIEPPHSEILHAVVVYGLLIFGILVPAGSIYLLAKTKNGWWLLTLLPFLAFLVLWLLRAMANVPGLH